MTPTDPASAQLPPASIPELDPAWSRLVRVPTTDGVGRTWHLLDNQVASPRLTLLCVHGNPAWSYLWRRVLADAPNDVRVIAVDQLDMGYSERTGEFRRLDRRITDLCQLTDQLSLTGPVVSVGHDWGGPISLGWAQRHLAQLAGVVLLNTAVHQPEGSPAPFLIRNTRRRGVLPRITSDTTAFIRGAWAMSPPKLARPILDGFLAPFDTADRRLAVRHFVEDIPLDPSHPSATSLDTVADRLADLVDVPVLLFWGAKDLVFSDLYLHDLERRLPHADVHRIAEAGHYSSEHPEFSPTLFDWLTQTAGTEETAVKLPDRRPIWEPPAHAADSEQLAIVELDGGDRSINFADLRDLVDATAHGLLAQGVAPGQRVALMIPPGIDLTATLYACWRIGVVAVLIDAGLGRKGMTQAIKSAAPDHLVGIKRALIAARTLRWPPNRISLTDLEQSGDLLPEPPTSDEVAAIVFTSGSTGPSKGVVYRHSQIASQRDALESLYRINSTDRLVAAFPLFALFGPALGMTTAVPPMDLDRPSSLNASSLADAVEAIDATLVFASPAAVQSVVDTAQSLTDAQSASLANVRLLLSAGAPVRAKLLRAATAVLPNADARTPYGMTEMMPVSDISLTELEATGNGDGVCVGAPIDDVEIRISPFDKEGHPTGELTEAPRQAGEIVVRGPHQHDSYDRLWHTTFRASKPAPWHRTGDIGELDSSGRLWVGGRLSHLLTTAAGPVMPVRIEQQVETVDGIRAAAVVGIGPSGTQQAVAVVEMDEAQPKSRNLDISQQDAVRSTAGIPLAAILTIESLPVDRRHNSKIDRARVARWADAVLRGERRVRL